MLTVPVEPVKKTRNSINAMHAGSVRCSCFGNPIAGTDEKSSCPFGMAPIFMSASDLRARDSRRVSEIRGGSVATAAGVVFVARRGRKTGVRCVNSRASRYSRLD